jgi:hypothetical protein
MSFFPAKDPSKTNWKAGRFDLVPGDTAEFIPLPE